ncbi:uncharacterized protein LOC114665152 isoform X1 [Erpetoichthys calabaricus]|uniref:uncharacterized protein LOC114665152 isoform X1 n=1 Tax=Erpetoichthys calabaricus TaxID=27687 RepID=UPI0022340811|nr:uncharacterized protein LOC114665152 isoform X1 [Erpetoichthys calabaricus]
MEATGHSPEKLKIQKKQENKAKRLQKQITDLCRQNPDGIPLSCISAIYLQTYHKCLNVKKCGFTSVISFLESVDDVLDIVSDQNGFVVKEKTSSASGQIDGPSASPLHHTGQTTALFPLPKFKGMPQVRLCQEILALLRCFPDGIDLCQLRTSYKEMYRKKLILAKSGIETMQELCVLLGNTVSIERRDQKNIIKIVTKEDFGENQEMCRKPFTASANLPESIFASGKLHSAKCMDRVQQEIRDLFEVYPEGIPLQKIAEFYNKKYKRNLTLAAFGFRSIRSFVQSVEGLQIQGDLALLKMDGEHQENASEPVKQQHLPATSTPEPPRAAPPVESQTVVPNASVRTASELSASKITKEQLFENISKVLKANPTAAFSMLELQASYFLCYKTPLPIQEYISLYDHLACPNGALAAAGSGGTSKPISEQPAGLIPQQKQNVGSNLLTPTKSTPPVTMPKIPISPYIPSFGFSFMATPEEFPALGGNLSKMQQKKLREDATRVDAYHSQIREVHNSTMQAQQVLEQDDLMYGARRKISVQDVNNLAEEFIRAISSEGEHVTVEKVILRLCRHLRVPALQSVKIDAHRDIPAIKELCRTLREINIFIESIEAVRTVCTLYEVGECIAALKAKKHFKELNVGPLCKIPLIHKMFKVPSTLKDEDIVEIETVDIIKNLRAFMRKQKGYKCKVDLPEFMKFISDQYKCDSPYDLGIRIQSIALSISTLRKAVNCEYDSMDKTKKVIQKEIEEEIEAKLRKVKKSLMEPASGAPLYSSSGSSEMRLKYAHMSASDAVMEVFIKAQDIFSKKMAKHVEGFLSYISGDRLAAAMFQMAICSGSLEAPVNLIEKTKPTKPMEENKTVLPPCDAELKQVLHTHISSFNGQLNLAYLSKIEKKMVEHFKFKDFSSMEHGTFLQFLVKHSQILQEAGGGALMISNQDVKNCSLRPSQQDVYELIRQCGVTDQTKIPDIEAAIKSHFKVKDTRELGYGTVAQLFNIVQKQKTYYEDHGNRKKFSSLRSSTICQRFSAKFNWKH